MMAFKILIKSELLIIILLITSFMPLSINNFLDSSFHIWFLDVGQGDAILIRTEDNKYILVDCGRDQSMLFALEKVLPSYVSRIDMLLLTHPDLDHLGGFRSIINKYTIDIIAYDYLFDLKDELSEVKEYIANNNKIYISLRYPDLIKTGNQSFLEVLWRDDRFNYTNLSDNDSSLTIKGDFRNLTFLLTGDLSYSFIEGIAKREDLSDIVVLKASHHGSKTGTSDKLLKQLDNSLIIFSSGKNNPYHHPAKEVIEIASNNNNSYFRTDLNGTIHIYCVKDNCSASTEK